MLVGPNWRSLDDANQIGLTTQANRPVPYHLGLWEWRWSTLSCFETSQLWLILLAVPTSFRSLFGFICCLCLVLLLSSFWDCFVSMFVLGFLIPVCFCSRILDFPSLFSAISVHFWILSHVCRFSFCKYPCLFSDFHQNLISFLHIFPWLDWLESLCQESKIENLKLKRGWGRAQHLPHQTHDHRCLIFYLFVSCFLPIMIMLKRICLCVCVSVAAVAVAGVGGAVVPYIIIHVIILIICSWCSLCSCSCCRWCSRCSCCSYCSCPGSSCCFRCSRGSCSWCSRSCYCYCSCWC